jgi:hypothetical protein
MFLTILVCLMGKGLPGYRVQLMLLFLCFVVVFEEAIGGRFMVSWGCWLHATGTLLLARVVGRRWQ